MAAAIGGPVVLLIGDVALAHDIGGLLAARRLGLRLTIVLLDNEGGGIFDFLPVSRATVARSPEPRDPHGDRTSTRATSPPHGLDFAQAAALYGLYTSASSDVAGFRAALERALAHDGSSIVEVRSERQANIELHARVWGAVSDALAPELGERLSPRAAAAAPGA